MVEFGDCLACRECCTFNPEDRYFSPVFTHAEMRRVQESGTRVEFTPKPGSHNVYQPVLTPSRRNGDVFICPLLDEETHRCTVYGLRPLDCRLWPFMFVKSSTPGAVDLYCFNDAECPSMRGQGQDRCNGLRERVLVFARSSECRDLLRAHPGLAWDPEPDTHLVERISLR